MSKAEARQRKLKARIDENARLIAQQKKDWNQWGGLMIGDKNYYHVTNIHRGILVGGRKK